MKKIPSLLNVALIIFFLTTMSDCSLINPDDPCDDTVKPEIEVGIKATIHVLDKDRNPIANQQVNLYLYKKPCGAAIKGEFDFSGPTNELGIRETTVAYYKLRNADDEVWVDVYAVNLGNGSAIKDSEYATYKYDDFFGGFTKEVDVYIYRDF
ncbi:MAG: hypothetical protein RBT02_11085 [Bacteroidales bacterium]|nr:hypothetical protein [Bacteroidales bacterium]